MEETKIPKTKPTSKFGKKTRQFSVRLPEDMIKRIKVEKIDTGQILYDVIECGMDPYGDKPPKRDIFSNLVRKFVQLMIDNGISTPEGFFNENETKAVTKIAEEVARRE